jgi:basic membrane lipoprotein Med (substrate-binding protein (PBP1-ABC) superfamily)
MDRGSRVVFAAAGECSLGALSATAIRGAWGIGVDIDRSYLGPHILVSVVKRVDRAVEYAVRSFLEGTLVDDDLDIGIERDAVGIVGINPEVPSDIRRKVAKETELHQKEWASWSTQ